MDTTERKPNLYDALTAKIIAAIKEGAGAFVMPWHGSGPPATLPTNAATAKAYRGVNVLSLWIEAIQKAYGGGYWASYRQWQGLGAQVRKGERGTMIVFWSRVERPEAEGGEAEEPAARFFAKPSWVFNQSQVDGWEPPAPRAAPNVESREEIDVFVAATGASVRIGGTLARYHPMHDRIEMPDRSRFTGTRTSSGTDSYYAILLHELTHWSGAPHRLDRQFGTRFGDRAYAMEELVAELGAAFLCASLSLTNEPRPDHAAYVSSWLEILGNDHRAIFTAASKAQTAVEYLTGLAASKLGQTVL